jgi:hypothetical protein
MFVTRVIPWLRLILASPLDDVHEELFHLSPLV